MNKKELWEGFLKQSPESTDPEHIVKLRARGLKALIDQAFDEGLAAGRKYERDLEKLKGLGKGPGESFLDGLFGKGGK